MTHAQLAGALLALTLIGVITMTWAIITANPLASLCGGLLAGYCGSHTWYLVRDR